MTRNRAVGWMVAGFLGVASAAGVAQDAAPVSDTFYTAIRQNDLAAVKRLLDGGADVNLPDPRGGSTPLMHAAAVGSLDAMRLLLDRGANVNAANAAGLTVLMMSATDLDRVRLLVDRGAAVNAATKRGRTAVMIAAASDNSAPIVRLLKERGADLKAADAIKSTVLHAALRGGDQATVQLALDAGVGVNDADFAGFTPLMVAAFGSNEPAVKLLLARGANVNAVSGDGSFQKVKAGSIALGNWTPLLAAAATAPAPLVETLLSAGADVNARDVRGMTPLMLAVATDRQKPEVIRAILARKPDVNIRSLAGETALDWAHKIGNPAVVRMLVAVGATGSPVPAAPAHTPAPVEPAAAVRRSFALLEKSTVEAAAMGGCASCHHHNITDMAASIARDKGVAIDAKLAADRRTLTRARLFSPAGYFERFEQGGAPDVEMYALMALAASGEEPDRNIDAALAGVLAFQRADGSWTMGGVARPPVEDGDIFRTALAVATLDAYAPPARAAEISRRVARASAWLARAVATTAEDRNMQLIALHCVETDPAVLRKHARAILAAQRADGGWAQTAYLTSDAYATGQTLVALLKTGMLTSSDAAYQKALKYLISTQRADGSWYVRSRSPKFQPYFESGFPYGHDQWISAMATGWAATAVAMGM